ncbi:MAG: hypothetical protein ACE5NP_06935 [Anaerolineae bacterium]
MTSREIKIVAILGLLVVIVYAVFISLVTQRFPLPRETAPLIQLASPLSSGVLVEEGQIFTLSASVTGGNVDRLELWVDNVLSTAVANPAPADKGSWSVDLYWEAREIGPHTLMVRAYKQSGQMAGSVPITVTVVPSNQIAFVSNRGGRYEIYTMRANGRQQRKLITGKADYREPAWSFQGDLAFVANYTVDVADIWLTRAGGVEQVQLTTGPNWDHSPTWSPDGGLIAFVSDRSGNDEIYVMNDDGADVVQLTEEETYDGQPTWAPDGQWLAFTSAREGNWDIYMMRPDGTGVTRLTYDPAQDWYPAWSPDGTKLAFVSNRSGRHQIYVMNTDGSGLTKLTDFPNGAEQPRWSPDGKWLVFVAYTGHGERLNAREIYLMQADGSSQISLTDNEYDDTEPAWYGLRRAKE